MSLAVRQRLEEAASVCVAVAGLQGVAPSALDGAVATLTTHYARVPLHQLEEGLLLPLLFPRGPFANLQIEDGCIRFNFVSANCMLPGDWANFQASRRVMAVLGFAQGVDVEDALDDLHRMGEVFPTALVCRCALSDSTNDVGTPPIPNGTPPQGDRNDKEVGRASSEGRVSGAAALMIEREAVVMYGEMLEEALSPSHVDVLRTVVDNLAVSLLRMMAQRLEDMESFEPLQSPIDSVSTPEDMSRLRKRRAGRASKYAGDLCLLAGAYRDASTHFIAAVEATKTTNDWLWLAGALEGLACGLLFLSPERSTHTQEVVDRLGDALTNYERSKAHFLTVECAFKLARIQIGGGRRSAGLAALVRAVEASEGLGIQDQIVVTVEVAIVCESIRWFRKCAFFLHRAAFLFEEIYNWSTAHTLLALSARLYQLNPVLSGSDEYALCPLLGKGTPNSARQGQGWLTLQRSVLRTLIGLANNMNDCPKVARYIAFMLGALSRGLEPSEQHQYITQLETVAKYLPVGVQNECYLPFLHRITPLSLPSHVLPTKRTREKGCSSIFIYSPFTRAAREREELLWVEGEVVEVHVELRNPLACPIRLESISLTTSGVPMEVYPVTVTLQPDTISRTVTLAGRPLKSGHLILRGCTLRFHKLVFEQLVDPTGNVIQGSSPPSSSHSIGISVAVVDPLPYLRVEGHKLSDVRSYYYDGERDTITLALINAGVCPITHLWIYMSGAMRVHPNVLRQGVHEEGKTACAWEDAPIEEALPLAPGKWIEFSVEIVFATTGQSHRELVLTFEYGSCEGRGSPEFMRKATLSYNPEVQQGLRITSADVLPRTVTHTTLPPEVILGATTSTEPRSESENDRFLVLEVMNPTPTVFRLEPMSHGSLEEYTPSRNPGLLVNGHTATRFIVPVDPVLCRLRIEEKQREQQIREEEIRKESGGVLPDLHSSTHMDPVSAGVTQDLGFRWKSSYNTGGCLPIRVALPVQRVTHVLSPEPVFVTCLLLQAGMSEDILWAGDDPQNTSDVPLHAFHDVQVTAHNRSGAELMDLSLSLTVAGDEDAASLQQRVAIVGTTEATIQMLTPGNTWTHTLRLCFLSAGHYQLDVTCRRADGSEMMSGPRTHLVKAYDTRLNP